MREGVDIVMGIGLAVALDVLDHLAPYARVAFDRKIDFLQIDGGNFADILELEDLELENIVARLAIVGDADGEGGVDEAEREKCSCAATICPLSASK